MLESRDRHSEIDTLQTRKGLNRSKAGIHQNASLGKEEYHTKSRSSGTINLGVRPEK